MQNYNVWKGVLDIDLSTAGGRVLRLIQGGGEIAPLCLRFVI